MSCYELVNGAFEEAQEPVDQEAGDDYAQNILKAGYFHQICTETHESSGAEVSLYETNDSGKPRYFIDVWGVSQQIAGLIARDFPHLLQTMKALAPLVSLVGLGQQADIDADRVIARASRS